MTRTPLKLAGRAVVAGIALSAMGILAASPANAAVPVLYTYLDADPISYATISATTGAATPLASAPTADPDYLVGQELFDGAGTSIGYFDAGSGAYYVYTWSTSGVADAGVLAFVTGADEGSLRVSGLDTLADGTAVTYVEYTVTEGGGEFPTTTQYTAIATVNRATGELTPVIDTTPLYESGYYVNSLATDPVSGVTYAFLSHEEDSLSYFTALDFVGVTFDMPTQFEGTGFESGFFQGADFDATGTLYFIYGNNSREMYELSSLGSPATWQTDARVFIADAPSNYDDYPLSTLALTTAPPLALASTGAEFPAALLAVGGVAVLAGAVTVVTVARKRRTA